MTDNIFRVRTEIELTEILDNNKYKLITVVYSTNDTKYLPKDIDILLKKLLKRDLAIKHANSIFIYINLSDFVVTSDKFVGNVNKENIPVAHFFWDQARIAVIEKLGSESLITVLNKLLHEINEKVSSKTTKEPSVDISSNTPPLTVQEPVAPNTIAEPEHITQPELPSVNPEHNAHVESPSINPVPQEQQVPNPLDIPSNLLGNIDQKTIDEQLLYQKKMEEIEKLRAQYEINELKKIKKLKENENTSTN